MVGTSSMRFLSIILLFFSSQLFADYDPNSWQSWGTYSNTGSSPNWDGAYAKLQACVESTVPDAYCRFSDASPLITEKTGYNIYVWGVLRYSGANICPILNETWDQELQDCVPPPPYPCDAPLIPNATNDGCTCPQDGDEYFAVINVCASPQCPNGTQRSELTGVCPSDCPKGESDTFQMSTYPPGTICFGDYGCEMQNDTILQAQTDTGLVYAASYTYTGYACAGGSTDDFVPFECSPDQVQKSCPGSSVTYCMSPETPLTCDNSAPEPVAPGSDDTPGESTPGESTSTTNDTAPKETTTSTSTSTSMSDNGDGTSTKTTTTTTTTNNPDGSTSTKTSTKTDTIDNATGDVISSNESTTQTDNTTGGDTVAGNDQCKNPPTCVGNAVDCATMINSWEQKCLLKKTFDYCGLYPADPQCLEEEKEPELLEEEVTLDLTPVVISSNATCPSGFTASTNLMGLIEFELTLVCDFMGKIKPFVLIFAWISAAFIVFGGMRGDS